MGTHWDNMKQKGNKQSSFRSISISHQFHFCSCFAFRALTNCHILQMGEKKTFYGH